MKWGQTDDDYEEVRKTGKDYEQEVNDNGKQTLGQAVDSDIEQLLNGDD